ncbi:hypothetical protein L3Y34_013730 [Caenorhabditis briggsae]|uniref:Uncharacterized protein n=1 Tax=Caenorhabditis briggsae TaxID=6238 RepID=A0AAE8ZZ60_CAEBR|nr:hypothetical protein L3Y34_013730 [Caenorhabditis briggsae]
MHLNKVLLFAFFFVIPLSDQCHPPRVTNHITVKVGDHVDFLKGDLISTKWCYKIPRFCSESNGTCSPNSDDDIGDYILNYRPRPYNTSSGIMLHVVARPKLQHTYDDHEVELPTKIETTSTGPSTWLPIVFPPTQTRNGAASPKKEISDSSADEVGFQAEEDTTSTRPSMKLLPIVFPPKAVKPEEVTVTAEVEQRVQKADEIWNILTIGAIVVAAFMLIILIGAFYCRH